MALALSLPCGWARAACDARSAAVAVQMAGGGWRGELATRTAAQLASGLRALGFGSCEASDATGHAAPVARVTVTMADGRDAGTRVLLVVEDAVTAKTVSRSVDLARYTDAEQPLVIAVAAEELVRSSWAELAYADAPAREPPPAEVTRAVRERIAPARVVGIAAIGGAEFTRDGATYAGGDLRFRLPLAARLSIDLAAGAREALARHVDRGVLSSQWMFGELAPGVRLVGGEAMHVDAEAALRVGVVFLAGDPSGDSVVAHASSAPSVVVLGGARGRVPLGGRFGLVLRAAAGMAALGVRAHSGDTAVGGIAGPIVAVGAGLEWGAP